MKTYSTKAADITRIWFVLDAQEVPLGRLATVAASLLLGKSKVTLSPHIDSGDYVIIINAAKLVVTGNKMQTKRYYHHSLYPGGLSELSLGDKLQKSPKTVVHQAVRGMLPVNKLRPLRLARLKIYNDAEHDHEAQKPQKLVLSTKKRVKG